MKTFTPAVNAVKTFSEITRDFPEPLDLIREAISNSYDSGATEIRISAHSKGKNIKEQVIMIQDNGEGMDERALESFFSLGYSSKPDDSSCIGEKGHGTKVYFNSHKIEVKTQKIHHPIWVAIVDSPLKKLDAGRLPKIIITKDEERKFPSPCGTIITITGYHNNQREIFSHDKMRDYIIWFTKHGTCENQFHPKARKVRLFLNGLGGEKFKDESGFEEIPQFHPFPQENKNIVQLKEKGGKESYCYQIQREGTVIGDPTLKYQCFISLEGNHAKYSSNPHISRTRRQAYPQT